MVSLARSGLVLVVVGLALGAFSLAAAPARAASVSVSLYGSFGSGWGTASASETNPGPTLTVNQGDSVTFALTSTDGFMHQFLIDYNGNGVADPGEPLSAPLNGTTTLTFVASQAGTFHYLCVIHPTAMKGTFTVQGTSNPSPSGTLSDSGSTLVVVGVLILVVAAVGASVLLLRRRR